MSDGTKIEWSDATWSPIIGCDRVSPGCDGCYAINSAHIRAHNPNPKVAAAFEGLTHRAGGRIDWTGRINLLPDRLEQPLRWKKPRRIFVNSQSDLFHADVPNRFIADVFAVMAATPQHTYQVLTKRHGRMRSLLMDGTFRAAVQIYLSALLRVDEAEMSWPLPNVWIGVSCEDQKRADLRVPALVQTPAAVRFISAEPLLGPVDLSPWLADLDWVIVGGESGPGARPMHPDWVRSLRDQCRRAGTSFFFKQWGEWIPEALGAHVITEHTARSARYADLAGGHRPANIGARNGAATCHRVGKKRAGRELDGREWSEFPQSSTAVVS